MAAGDVICFTVFVAVTHLMQLRCGAVYRRTVIRVKLSNSCGGQEYLAKNNDLWSVMTYGQ